MADAFSFLDGDAEHDAYLRVLGVDRNSFRSAKGQSVQDFTSRWTKDLGSISGYYDTGKVNNLTAGLGGTTSATYLNQLTSLAHEANKLYTYVSNPNMLRSKFEAASKDANSGVIFRSWDSGQWAFGFKENQRRDSAYAERALYGAVDAFSKQQGLIVEQLNAQQAREQNYVGQITGLIQQGTVAKSKADQAAAQKALQDQYNKQQADLNASAQANAKKLAEQQAQQEATYAKAQAEAARVAKEQQTALNKDALSTALSNASSAQLQQAKAAVTQAESQASSVRGGEAISSTNAASKSKTRQTTRTERWQSTRSPAAGGGGISI